MKQILVGCLFIVGLSACSTLAESRDSAECRDIATKRVADDARSVDATYALCTQAREAKRKARTKAETAESIFKLIDSLFG